MKRSSLAATALLVSLAAGSAHAFRVLEPVEHSVELSLGDLTLPGNPAGTVRYRTCATCSLVSRSVGAATIYRLDDRVLSLADLAVEVEKIRAQPSIHARAMAFVYYDLDTGRVNRVVVRAGGA